jgi:hypothetical protein
VWLAGQRGQRGRYGLQAARIPGTWHGAIEVQTDRLDAQLLARVPVLHPEGLHPELGNGPADPLKRAVKIRRLARWFQKQTRKAWGEQRAAAVILAAEATLALWGPTGLDYEALAADIAVEATIVPTPLPADRPSRRTNL